MKKPEFQFLIPALLLILGGVSCSLKLIDYRSVEGGNSNSGASGKVRFAKMAKISERPRFEAFAKKSIISTQGEASTAAARKMLEEGGNLIDAAVAASFALSVERPQSTGIGGGGAFLYREGSTGKTYVIDFRERAPVRATEKMFLDRKGKVIVGASTNGVLSTAVPGLVAGLLEIHQKWGNLPLATVMGPAIQLAEQGVTVYPHLAKSLELRREVLSRYPSSRKVYLKADGSSYREGDVLIQHDLGQSLRLIMKGGKNFFYKGALAKAILAESEKYQGLLSQEDFDTYTVKWRKPLYGKFKGYDIISGPPPLGGAQVVEILNILEDTNLAKYGILSPDAIHLTAAAMQFAYADRAKEMGDPDFVKVPIDRLISKNYARDLRAKILPRKAQSPDDIQSVLSSLPIESTETTHFSMMDAEGNMVSSTQTIDGRMGSGLVVEGTGILLNNEMDDFSAKPGAPNIYGAIGGTANAIAPGKTPLSSMAPTLVLKDGRPILALGAPGGTRIISCVAETILNYLEFGRPLFESIAMTRFHHQWVPNILFFESPGPGDAAVSEISKMGYQIQIEEDGVPCRVMAVASEGDGLIGVSDPRGPGLAAGI